MYLAPMSAGLIALAWFFAITSTLTVGLRLWVRYRLRGTKIPTVDDVCVLITYGLAITNTVLLTVSAYWGLGRHQETLADSPQHIIFAIKWAFLAEGPNILASGFARISFAFLLLTITPPTKNKRIFLWSIIAIQFAADLAAVIVTYSQCRPLIAYWDPRVKGDCWPPTYQQYTGFTQGSIAAAVDVTLALYPISLFWNLNIKRERKYYLSCIMGLGIIASAASIAKTVYLKSFTETEDFTYALSITAYWWTSEINLVLFAVSLPILSPLIRPPAGLSNEASGAGRKGPGPFINTFLSNKMKKTNDSSDTRDGDFELLQDLDGYPDVNTSNYPPLAKTYDCKITPQDRHFGDHVSRGGIQREISISITSGEEGGSRGGIRRY
ncbi:integral membrane protein [Hypoxylon argillaceum]|nr:integral membrane protein [Hypoxylon argillaceum]KAI1145215.1 integral membrane protein [Nemania diffusa]